MAVINTIPIDPEKLPFEIDIEVGGEDFTLRFARNDEVVPEIFTVEIKQDDVTIGISQLTPDFSILETTLDNPDLNNLIMSSLEDFIRVRDGQVRENPSLTLDNFGTEIELVDANT